MLTKYVFTNNNAIIAQIVYSDADCKTKTNEINFTFSYTINNEKDPKEIDLTTTASVSQTYYTQEGVDEANQDCTEPLFSINKAILSENIEKSCPELAEDSNFPTVGDSFYNIYKVENNKLFFGNSSEAPTDAQNRPTAIDDTVAYSKQ